MLDIDEEIHIITIMAMICFILDLLVRILMMPSMSLSVLKIKNFEMGRSNLCHRIVYLEHIFTGCQLIR